MAERDGTPMKEAKPQGVLGTLWLVAKKTGADMQSFPIDADRVTIGRDWDSDIRLYFSDVSKLHCEIKFDLITGDASMHVHGTHGVRHAPQGGETAAYKPPSIIPLADRDTFIIRKKLFRFEYGHSDYLIDTPTMQTQPLPLDSPVKSASPAPAPRRKRVSHRMSLVPSGKNFEPFASPMKSRRHSIIGLGEGPQVIRTPKKSGLAQQIEEEEDEQEEEEEEEVVVEAVDGEEGDVLYVETREDDIKPVHSNPFMTPQQKGKAPMRNTSAVPRTRKLHFETTAPIATTTIDGTASPQTPRSVPLPPMADTPYASAENTPAPLANTPRSVPLPPTDNTPFKVTAQVAMSTPKGPVSLHKALLLRSARKAWQSSQAQGVDGAIVNGDVTTKRKSLSPKAQARKSLTPMPVPEEEEVSEEEEDEEDEEEGELQWVYEDGRASISIDESDSSIDSLEAEQSLDIPGQGVISFGTMTAEEAEEMEHNGASMEEESVEESDVEGQFEAEEEQGEFDVEQEEEEGEEEAESMEQDQEQPVEVVAATPRRPLERFYTPQPQRTMAGGPRRSLADISGPAMRSSRQPETPVGPVRRIPATPGSLGPPSRRVIAPVQDYEDEDEEEEVKPMPNTPARREVNPALLAEAKRRRETLGTPRALPSFPASFKTPVREVSLRGANKTPSHPALEPTTPETDSPDREPAVPMTPLEKVQKELNALRRQSVQRQQARNDAGRRATVSFALPSTPARPQPKASTSYTVVGTRQQPRAFAMTMEEDEESEPSTPVMAGQDVGEVSALHATPAPLEEEEEEEEEDLSVEYIAEEDMNEPARTVPATPSFAGMKEMFHTALVPPKTPSFSGIRSMFASPSQSAPTPRLDGVREMFRQPDQPATPQMNGIRSMFALPREQGTPDMEGLKEMYEEDEVEEDAVLQTDTESEEDEVVEGYSEIIVVASPPKPKAAPIKKASTSAPSRSRVPAATVAKSTNTAPAAASRVPVASSSSRTKATSSSSASASTSATEKKAAPAVRKIPAPRARAPIKAEPAPKKTAAPAVTRPRPGDIDDVSLSEIEEPLEYEEPVKPKAEIPKPQTTRTTGTRAKKPETVKAPAKSTSTASRTKKQILGENEEQHSTEVPAPAPAKATRAKKTIEKSTSAPSTTTSAPSKAASTSAPARRTRTATVEKENEPEVKKAEPVKKAPVRRAVKKVAEPIAEPVVTTRTTRSRK